MTDDLPTGTPLPPAPPARPAAWLPDPLDDALVRYWDGHRWTFHTAVRRTVVPVEVRPRDQAPPPAVPALRPDVLKRSGTGLPAQPRGTGPQGVLQRVPLQDSSGGLRQHPRMDSGMRVLSGTAVLSLAAHSYPIALHWGTLSVVQEIRWTSESEAHIARHGVTPEDVEQAVNSKPRYEAPGREDSILLYLRH